jgi:hypothetical protein
MTGSPEWYYETESGVSGPVSAAGLRDLVKQGAIRPDMLIRRGKDGPWFLAGRVQDALESMGKAEPITRAEGEAAEWYFSRKDQRKLGPVPWSMLLAMSRHGKLDPVDSVWKPGMASWAAVGAFPDLVDGCSGLTITNAVDSPPSRRWYTIRIALAGAVFILALIVVTGRHWIHGGRGDSGGQPDRVENVPTVIGHQVQQGQAPTPLNPRPNSEDTEELFEDALEAVKSGDFDRAKALLERYLSDPDARKVAEASGLRREIILALSAEKADELSRGLNDEQFRIYVQAGVESLVESSLRTPSLRPLYTRTLLQAFRKESARRQALPKGGEALAQATRVVAPVPRAVEAADPPEDDPKPLPPQTSSLLGSDDDGTDAPGRVENPKRNRAIPDGVSPDGSITLDAVLARPSTFEGKTLVLDGLYKIGTRLSKVDDPDGNALGWSLPVGSSDVGVIYPDHAKVDGRDIYLVLEAGLAPLLDRVFKQLRFNAASKPSYKCILTVKVREMIVNNGKSFVVELAGLEILGTCDFLQVARRRYEKAFRTVQISSERAFVAYGDGASWVERLGGEEKFVLPLRRKVRELQRKIAAERDQVVIASILQSELSRVVNMAAVAQEQHRRMLAAMMGRQLLP